MNSFTYKVHPGSKVSITLKRMQIMSLMMLLILMLYCDSILDKLRWVKVINKNKFLLFLFIIFTVMTREVLITGVTHICGSHYPPVNCANLEARSRSSIAWGPRCARRGCGLAGACISVRGPTALLWRVYKKPQLWPPALPEQETRLLLWQRQEEEAPRKVCVSLSRPPLFLTAATGRV